jgi:hypothetical protein
VEAQRCPYETLDADLRKTLEGVREGRREAEGISPRTYRVNARIWLETGFPWHNL